MVKLAAHGCAVLPPLCSRVFRDVGLLETWCSTRRARVVPHAAYPMYGEAAVPSEGWVEPLTGETEQRSKVSAEIKVHAPADVLWGVLTDFSSHVDLMPNVQQCEQLPSRRPDTELLFQKVSSQTPFWSVEASAMLEYRQKRAKSWRKMNFRMISGDFAELSGHWVVAEDPNTPLHSVLRYEIVFLPMCKAAIPCAMKQFLAKQVLPCNIMALAAHAEQLSQGSRAPQMNLEPVQSPSLGARAYTSEDRAHLAPGWIEDRRPSYLGVSSVPLPGQRSSSSKSRKGSDVYSANQAEVFTPSRAQQDEVQVESSSSHAWRASDDEASTTADVSAGAVRSISTRSKFSDMEMYIRKLGTERKLHWRLLSSVPVKASAEAIWEVLTNYEQLDEVVPLLLVSEEKKAASGERHDSNGSRSNLKRIRQVASKQLPYVTLHTEVVLDVLEKPGTDTWELQFKHHSSSFDMLQGKWVIERVPSSAGSPHQPSHVLKYAVELAVNAKPSRFIDLMEPLIERSIAEDLPSSLDALRNAAEELYNQGMPEKKSTGKEVLMRAEKTYDLFEELRAELTALYGSRLQLPNRKELLSSGRVDLINAIKAHGGYTQVAEQLQWSVAKVTRRPRGYWSIIANVQNELDLFNDEFDQPMDSIPRKSFLQKLGRYDLVKGLERNGGAHMVAEILGYAVASGRGAVPEPEAANTDETRADVAEAVGRELLEQAHAAGHASSASLPSVDELLMDANSFDADGSRPSWTNHDRVHSGRQRNWSGSNGSGWVDGEHLGHCLNEPGTRSRGHVLRDAQLDVISDALPRGSRGKRSSRARNLGWAVSSNTRKLKLDVRDVDNEAHGDGPAWVASQSYGRRVLSKGDLKALLSDSDAGPQLS